MGKIKYSREDVIKATYDLMKQEGVKSISARKIAKRLRSSTAPIYAHFTTLEMLKEEIIEKAKSSFLGYINEEYTENALLNVAMGIVIFAREEKELFKPVFLMDDNFKDLFDITINQIVTKAKEDERFNNISHQKINDTVVKIWYYVHGYATLVSTEFLKNQTNEIIKEKILELTTIVIKNISNEK